MTIIGSRTASDMEHRKGADEELQLMDIAELLMKHTTDMPRDSNSHRTGLFLVAQWLHGNTAWRALGPALALIYNIWSIPLRLVFLPEFTLSSKFAVFVTLDYLADFAFVLELLVLYYSRQIRQKKIRRVSPESPHDENGPDRAQGSLRRNSLHTMESFRDIVKSKEKNTLSKAMQRHSPHAGINGGAISTMIYRWTRWERIKTIATVTLCVAAMFPCEVVAFAAGSRRIMSFRSNRLIGIVVAKPLHDRIYQYASSKGFLVNTGLQRMATLFLLSALAGHLASCWWFHVACHVARQDRHHNWAELDSTPLISAANGEELKMLVSWSQCYLRSIYWALITMITTGFGDIVPTNREETIVCVCSMYTGVFLCTISIANLTSLFLNLDRAFTAHENKMDALNKYMKYRKLPNDLMERIRAFYEYQWLQFRGVNEQQIISELPSTLRQQVANQITCELLRNLPILRKAHNALLNALAPYIESNIYSPGDAVVAYHELQTGALVMSRGVAEVMHANGRKVLQRLERGDHFGLHCLFEDMKSHNVVMAKTYCEVFTLPKEAFSHITRAQCTAAERDEMRIIASRASKSSSKRMQLAGGVDDSLSAIHGFRQIFLPTSRFRRWWDVIMFFASGYYCFSIPIWIAVSFPPSDSGGFSGNAAALIIAYLVDVLFMLDVIFRYRLFFFMEDGIVVIDPDRIIQKFRAETSVPYEVLCCFPWDIAAAFVGSGYCPLLRVTKLPRLLGLPRHLDKVEREVQQLFVYMSMPFKRLLNLNLAMYLLCHWVGCCFIFVGRLSKYWGYDNWIDADAADSRFFIPAAEGRLPACLYLRAVYWAIVGMSTVGYGDIVPKSTPEMLFATIIVLFGGLTVPAMVGGLAACVSSLNQAQDQYRAKITRVRELLNRKRYSAEQSNRVLRYYNYIWSRQGGVDEVSILNELPGPLRQRVCHSIAGNALRRISFFSGIPDNIINCIVSVLVPRVFVPGDEIMHAKEIGKEFYIIEKGRVHICSPNDVITYAVLGEGDCFGESCLLTKLTVRCSNVKCFSYCDCFELSKEDFNETLEAFPEEKEMILVNLKIELERKVRFNQNLTLNFQRHREKMLQKFENFFLPETIEEARGRIYARSGLWEALRARVVAPDTVPREVWNLVLLLATLYNAFAVPFRIAFLTKPMTFAPDYILDCFFFLDIFLRFHCFGFEKEGSLVTDRDQIRQTYLASGFRRDIAASFPFEVFLLLLRMSGANMGDHWPLVMACTRLPKVIRGSKLLELGRQLKTTLAVRFPHVNITVIFLLQLLSGVILVSHWAACGFVIFARFKNYARSFDCNTDDFEGTNNFDASLTMTARAQCIWQGTWISLQIEDGKLPANGYTGPYASGTQYVRGLNWALPTLVVVVIGDVLPTTCLETLYVFVCILLGMTVNAVIIGNIAGLVANLDTDSAAHITKSDALSAYMHHHHIPLDLQQRVTQYMSYVWNIHNGGTINEEYETLSNLPVTLQQDLAVSSKLPFIKKCPFFDFCSDDVHRALATSLQSLRFSKGDTIVQYGDLGAEMYFIVNGEVEVVSADKTTIYATLTAGAFFGEQALFFKKQRAATIRASDFCEILLLTKSSLDRELISREFDLTRMMKVFDGLKGANQRRNASLTANLKLSEDENSKLHKIVFPARNDSEEANKMNAHLKPGSLFRFSWDFVSLVLILYYACSLPYRAAFVYNFDSTGALKFLAFDFIVDSFFILDIILRFTLFPFVDAGIIVTRTELIRRHYYEASFLKDVVASFPLEILCAVPSVGIKQILVLRLVHLIRVGRLVEYLLLMEQYLTEWDFRISSSLTLIGRMFTIYILVNHGYACIWFALHRLQAPYRSLTWALTSKMPLSELDSETDSLTICSNTIDGEPITMVDCYNRAFYMVITTMSTVGYGDIYPTGNLETIWEIVVVLTGCSLFGSVVGSWQALLKQTDETGDNAFKEKMARLMNYMQYRQFHTGLKNAIVLHYAHLWHSAKCLDEAAVVEDLPGPLRMEIAHFVVGRAFLKIPVIVECMALTKKRLADSMRKQIGAADTTIYEVGDIGWDIYFISSGMVRVQLPERDDDSSSDDDENEMSEEADMFPPRLMARRRGIVLGELYREGNHFGEGCLTSTSGVRVEDTTSLAVVELFTISRDKIENVLAYLPESRRQEFITHLLTRNGVVTHTFVTESQRIASKKLAQTLKVKGSIDSPDKRSNRRKQSTFGQVTGAVSFRQQGAQKDMGLSSRIRNKLKGNALLARLKVKAKKGAAESKEEKKSSNSAAAQPNEGRSSLVKLSKRAEALDAGSFTMLGGKGLPSDGSFSDAHGNLVDEGSFLVDEHHRQRIQSAITEECEPSLTEDENGNGNQEDSVD